MRPVWLAFILPLLLIPGVARGSDGERPVFAFLGLKDSEDSFTTAELRVFENRVTSELVSIAEEEGFSVTIPENRIRVLERMLGEANGDPTISLQRLVSAYAVVGGRLERLSDRVSVDLRTMKVDDETLLTSVTSDFPSVQTALSEVRQIVAEVFVPGIPALSGDTESEPPEGEDYRDEVQMADLVGEWLGDTGLSSVEIQSDGTAIASLSDGGTMQLRIAIEGNRIVARQDEPNAPKLYMSSFPYTVAVQIVDIARPMQWEFTLSEDGETLSGVKDTTFFQVDRGRVVWADNTYSRDAVWTRRE